MSGPLTGLTCHLCRRPLGATVYVVLGWLGTYSECEWCYEGRQRPDEPELITDTFAPPPPPSRAARSLDAILDKLTGEQA